MKQLTKFVEDNKLTFNSGSGGDVNILALCGYATYINASLKDCIKVANNKDCNDEIERIYKYAKKNNYAAFWTKPEAHTMYIFEDKKELIS